MKYNKFTVFTGNITRQVEVEIRRTEIKKGQSRIFGKEEFNPKYCFQDILEFVNSIKPLEDILIEYPETFLQDKQQSVLVGKIVEKANTSNITLVTHSEHIINGILVAIRKRCNSFTEGISTEDVSIYHFGNEEVTLLNITSRAKILNTPNGFFDQSSIDRKIILGFVD